MTENSAENAESDVTTTTTLLWINLGDSVQDQLRDTSNLEDIKKSQGAKLGAYSGSKMIFII